MNAVTRSEESSSSLEGYVNEEHIFLHSKLSFKREAKRMEANQFFHTLFSDTNNELTIRKPAEEVGEIESFGLLEGGGTMVETMAN